MPPAPHRSGRRGAVIGASRSGHRRRRELRKSLRSRLGRVRISAAVGCRHPRPSWPGDLENTRLSSARVIRSSIERACEPTAGEENELERRAKACAWRILGRPTGGRTLGGNSEFPNGCAFRARSVHTHELLWAPNYLAHPRTQMAPSGAIDTPRTTTRPRDRQDRRRETPTSSRRTPEAGSLFPDRRQLKPRRGLQANATCFRSIPASARPSRGHDGAGWTSQRRDSDDAVAPDTTHERA